MAYKFFGGFAEGGYETNQVLALRYVVTVRLGPKKGSELSVEVICKTTFGGYYSKCSKEKEGPSDMFAIGSEE